MKADYFFAIALGLFALAFVAKLIALVLVIGQ